MSDDAEVIKFETLKRINRTAAKAIYDGLADPSIRNLSAQAEKLGWKLPISTAGRWIREGFEEGRKPKPIEKGSTKARKSLVKAVNKLSDTAAMKESPAIKAVNEALGQNLDPDDIVVSKFSDLMKKTKMELREQFDKTTMACGIILAEAVAGQHKALALMPKDSGAFIADMSEVTTNLKVTADDIPDHANGEGARIINGQATHLNGNGVHKPSHPLSDKIAQFRREKGFEVA